MTLVSGARLGPYEILAPIGAGGMGEVWRARDTRLDRVVAIKVLPAVLSQNAQLRIRFEREARTISQLTHPHICTLFDVGHESGRDFLVMEHLEGESLADRLARGPLPLEQVLRHGIEIAEALDRAHRAGVVHRDLKPGNVMLTKSGAKLLDFGLAKPAPLGSAADATEHKPLTADGVIVGTFQYMAPEQLEGREADARTDLFAFGALLYEMMTGKRAFEGSSRASLIAAILDREPEPISVLQPLTPPALEHLVRRCLSKDPDARWQTAHDVRLQLEWILESRSGVVPAVEAKRRTGARVSWTAFAIAALAAIAFGALYARKQAEPRPVVAASIIAPAGAKFAFRGGGGPPAISPDGTRVAFTATESGTDRLWVRALDQEKAQLIPGSDGATFPFWSSDGKRLAFFTAGKLKKVSLDGAPPVLVCDVRPARGGAWHGDTIIFGSRFDGIYRTTSGGSPPVRITTLDAKLNEATHRWPLFLPGGRHFLYLASPTGSEGPENTIWVAPLDAPQNRRALLKTVTNVALAGEYLVYVREGALVAQRIDLDSLTLHGDPLPVAPVVAIDSIFARAMFDATPSTFVLQSGGGQSLIRLMVLDGSGKIASEVDVPGAALGAVISPDQKSLAVTLLDRASGKQSVWVVDRTRGTTSRLTFGARDGAPVWSPDGKWIAHNSRDQSGSGPEIILLRADGSGVRRVLTRVDDSITPHSWSPDGRYIVASRRGRTATELWAVDVADGSLRRLFGGSSTFGAPAAVSRDGKWLAYSSDETGAMELYLTRFPSAAGKWQVSNAGGRLPRWSHDGKRLYYLDSREMLHVVEVDGAGDAPQLSKPEPMFRIHMGTPGHPYDVLRDGTFLVAQPTFDTSEEPLTLITNWTEKLRAQ